MEAKQVKDLMEVYSSIYAPQEKVEQLDENTMASRTAGMSSGQRDAASSNVSSGVAHRMGRRTDASAFGGRTIVKASGMFMTTVTEVQRLEWSSVRVLPIG